jgi:3-oxoacyl-(acyl-carrier-protein) synthase
MRWALKDAGISSAEVDYINAHGTGTQTNDVIEAEAIRRVFSTNAGGLLVSSTKSMHGHTLGAAGAIEAVLTAKALSEGLVPPTINFQKPDPACDLDVVPNEARKADLKIALSNTFAFGGLNATLVLRRAATSER